MSWQGSRVKKRVFGCKVRAARLLAAVSKNLDYLVVGENPGSKLTKARQLGIKILNQKEFEAIFLE